MVSWMLVALALLAGAEDLEQRLGPFSIAGEAFTVVLHKKRPPAESVRRAPETVAGLEIRDRSGVVLYEKHFASEVVEASARLLPGTNGTGLLIRYVVAPATPGTAERWQLFGFRNGKLALFDNVAGRTATGPFTGTVARGRMGAMPLSVPGDVVELRVWTGRYYAIVPARVDWRSGQWRPGQQCFETAPGGGLRETGCEMRVIAERRPPAAGLTFARVFSQPQENEWGVRHVVLKRDSKVEFLGTRALATWTATGDMIQISLGEPWLKVLIDDSDEKMGWVHDDEDLAAVGLPPGSSVP